MSDLGERLVAADLLELVAADQLVGQHDGVDPLAQVVQVADRVVDHLVRVAVEVVGRRNWHDLVQDIVVQQDAAQHAPLGLEVLRRQAVCQCGRPSGRGRPPARPLPLCSPCHCQDRG